MIDDRVFGDIDSFRAQFTSQRARSSIRQSAGRLAPVCKRTLRKQVQPYVSYTAFKAIVEEFTPSSENRRLSRLVADYLRRPNLKALPEGQRQLILSCCGNYSPPTRTPLPVRWKRWPNVSKACWMKPARGDRSHRSARRDYESLDETADEWSDQDADVVVRNRDERDALSHEIDELRHFKQLATNIRDNAKG